MSTDVSEKLMQDAQASSFTIVDQVSLCVECSDHKAALFCKQCEDNYCDLCFAQLHRFGFRSLHLYEVLSGVDIQTAHLNTRDVKPIEILNTSQTAGGKTTGEVAPSVDANGMHDNDDPSTADHDEGKTGDTIDTIEQALMQEEDMIPAILDETTILSSSDLPRGVKEALIFYESLAYRCHFIPIRLSDDERNLLEILESALSISEYTDKLEVLQLRGRDLLAVEQIKSFYNLIGSLYIAQDYRKGRRLFLTSKEGSTDYRQNAQFFQRICEIGRRHKIRNPDKMRSKYGKLMAICTDSKLQTVREHFQFDLAVPVRTIGDQCKQWGIAELLFQDPQLEVCVAQVDVHNCQNRDNIAAAIKLKQKLLHYLCEKYAALANHNLQQQQQQEGGATQSKSVKVTPQDIHLVIASITDAHAFLFQSLTPLKEIHHRLHRYFTPDTAVLDISIQNGTNGARLTHTASQQFRYVHQTFLLWGQIILRMYELWSLSDEDLLCGYSYDESFDPIKYYPSSYTLRFTGQGINRMQSCPRVGRCMSDVLQTAYRLAGGAWIGSSAVHLGDINVPNALFFIDKYTQVERILSPLFRTVREAELGHSDPSHPLYDYFQNYYTTLFPSTTLSPLVHHRILSDYFKHAFDGSGADDYFSAGSCIDGRLTSSYQWCSKIEKKAYYNVFLMTGFTGFDG